MALQRVTTKYGTVVGKAGELTECSVFLGIPYAKPPIGTLRFQAPQEPESWDGELECVKYGPAPIQMRRLDGPPIEMSEDCLTLNIFTPAKSREEKLPVMFWIFGGGFFAGSTSDPHIYGENLTKKGVVVVTVNYRVGVFGFMALPELEKKNGRVVNAGIMDQIAALKWVRDNIAEFGGDPDRVLVHGQSAGGMSTRMLLTSPLAQGLFSRAIVQSGGGLNEADPIRPKEEFMEICNRAMEHLGWTVEDLQNRDAKEVYEQMHQAAKDTAETFEVGYFQPFIDQHSIVEVPGKLIAQGKYMDIPIICGTVSGDAWMFSRKVKENFDTDLYFRGFSYSPGQAWARLQVKAGRTPIYTYYMDRTQPKEPGANRFSKAPHFGSQTPHSSEIVYVFGTLDRKSNAFTAYDHELSDVIQTYWTNFAKNGNPNREGLKEWPVYTAETPYAMHFGDEGYQAENIVQTKEEERTLDITEKKPGLLTTLEDF